VAASTAPTSSRGTARATPQPNAPAGSWLEFYRDRRLRHQLALAAEHGLEAATVSRGERLAARLERLLGDHRPLPSLLHGDLWSGNWAVDAEGAPGTTATARRTSP